MPENGPSPLSAAAEALEAELKTFERLAETVRTQPLDSQKGLQQAASALGEVAQSDERLGQRLRALVAAVGEVRERQAGHAEAVTARATEIQRRTEVFRELIERFEALGTDAQGLNALIQGFNQEGGGGQTDLSEIPARLDEVAGRAGELADSAFERDFADVGRMTEGLRQQLLSARNRLNLLTRDAPQA